MFYVQAINCERVASAVDHESTLGDLDRVLRENISLQDMVLSQAQQVCLLEWTHIPFRLFFFR